MSNTEAILLLKDMFPTYDEEILLSVLEDCGNNVERATDCLLNLESGGSVATSAVSANIPNTADDERLARELAQSEYSGGYGSTGFGNTAYVPTTNTKGRQAQPKKHNDDFSHSVQLESLDSEVIKEVLNGIKGGVIPIMLKQLSQMTIPSISEKMDTGKMGLVEFALDQIKVAEAHVPEENVDIKVDKTEIIITVKDISAKLDQFHWSYEKHAFPKMKDNGNANASIDDTEIEANLTIGMDGYGNPTVNVSSCTVKIGKLDVKISGTMASFLYNTVLALFKKTIKSSLEQSLSQMITESVNNDNTLEFF